MKQHLSFTWDKSRPPVDVEFDPVEIFARVQEILDSAIDAALDAAFAAPADGASAAADEKPQDCAHAGVERFARRAGAWASAHTGRWSDTA